jgi:hypothetical protein
MAYSALKNKTHLNPFIMEGIVMDTNDPLQMGRIKIWVPALDSEHYAIENLPWAEYASPLAGITTDFPAGRNKKTTHGHVAYGFWGIPKLNAQVLIFLLNGDPNRRFFFASYFDHQRNRSLPLGRNLTTDLKKHGPFSDTEDPIEPAMTNLKIAFNIKPDDMVGLADPLIQQLGSFERQVAQAQTQKDGLDGYANSAADAKNYNESQTYCWVTPGHHAIIMNDGAADCKVKIQSCEGHQILMDDTNKRIYIKTAVGNNWIELSEDGNIFVYSSESVSIRAQKDINFTADRNINLKANGMINIKSEAETRITSGGSLHLKSGGGSILASACGGVDINSGSDLKLGADGSLHVKGGNIIQSGGNIHLNGPDAAQASCAADAYGPSIIPAHEKWDRPNVDKTKLTSKTPQMIKENK